MYRVGFGDFFLITIPTAEGPQHILIDCGVFKGTSGTGDIHTIESAVANLAQETGGELALVVMTHRHADHIIGFSRCKDAFRKMKVGAVWMPIWESEYDETAQKFQAQLTKTALAVDAHLTALATSGKEDALGAAARDLLYNATGAGSLAAAAGGGSNAASLDLLKRGFGVNAEYYKSGDEPKVPPALAKAGLSVRVLGPPPVDEISLMKLMDLTKGVGEYLAASGADGNGGDTFAPFGLKWRASASDYPSEAFKEWSRTGTASPVHHVMEKVLAAAQPTSLYAAAKTLDSFLNNQSLVLLFTFAGKKMLFVGDAQAGNWEHWLYGTATPEKSPTGNISDEAKAILASLDFYKVGHHGSTNATPIPAVEAMREGVVAMCSTEPGVYGTESKGTEVPRGPLMENLGKKVSLVRSDQIEVQANGTSVPTHADAARALPEPAHGKLSEGACWIDYEF
jgi:hypothetical protein